MKNMISRRSFLQASGLAAAVCAAGALSACGSTSAAASSAAASSAPASSAADSDWSYISGKGELVIGMTIFEPMNYYDANNTLIGFDTELAQAACKKLGLTATFQEIDWDNKVIELNAKNIDCIWNGMTITDELGKSIDFSTPYSGNMQVCVINAANKDQFTDADTINADGVQVGAEAGSAGEAAAQESFPNAALTSVNAQRDCLMELKSGTLDVGVIDYVMAKASTGEGTSYTDLMIVPDLELSKEEYGVGLRKGSDFTAKLNDALQQLAGDGTVDALAEKYPSVMVTL
ncbi:MAG: transporter substrate-binding domain-containing protein [Faecalibacterium sp.]|jgi:polar amino acid transport system substrate-binding protein|nr:transporter substrate-binding domain-containing protein [Faecalibacterium sp.]